MNGLLLISKTPPIPNVLNNEIVFSMLHSLEDPWDKVSLSAQELTDANLDANELEAQFCQSYAYDLEQAM